MTTEISEDLDFNDLSPVSVPVRIAGKRYALREADGDAACRYRNAMLACSTLGTDGHPTSVKGLADVEPLLVSLCLFRDDTSFGKDNGKNVPIQEVRAYPAKMLTTLYNKAVDISGLSEGQETVATLRKKLIAAEEKAAAEEAASKNSSESTEIG